VLGILSLVACQLCGPFAWSMGNRAKRAIDAEPGRYSNASNVTVGRILGIVASVLLIVQAVFGVLWLLLVLGSIGASSTSGY
jgi:phage tail sheath protein FI